MIVLVAKSTALILTYGVLGNWLNFKTLNVRLYVVARILGTGVPLGTRCRAG